MVRIPRQFNLWVLVAILGLNGCSLGTLLFSAKSEDPVVLIDSPPMRVAYAGSFNTEDHEQFVRVLEVMRKVEYRDHNRSFPFGVGIHINQEEYLHSSTLLDGSKNTGVANGQ